MNFFPYMLEGWISDSHRITVSLFTPKIIPTCLPHHHEQYLSLQLSNHRIHSTSVLFLETAVYTSLLRVFIVNTMVFIVNNCKRLLEAKFMNRKPDSSASPEC
jgi:hypothetical protein